MTGPRLLDGERRALTVGLVLVVTLVAFEALAVATTLPATLRDLGGVALYGWAFSAFMLASLIGITAAGWQADARGPAGPLGAGLVLFGIGLVVVGVAPTMAVVVAGRAVQGFGAGAIPAVAYVGIGRGYPEVLRPRMFAVLSTAWVVPGLVGPAVSGLVADHLGWRWVFLGLLPLLPVAAALVLPPIRAMPASQPGVGGAGRVGRAAQLAAGAALLLSGLDTRSPVLAVALVIGGGAVGVPALRRLLPSGTLRARAGLPAAVASRGLLTFPFFGAEAFLPLMITSVRHQSTTVAGLALTSATLSWTAGSWVQVRLSERSRPSRLARVGLVFVAVGIGGIAVCLSPRVPVALVGLGWGSAGFGMGIAYPLTSLVVLAGADEAEVGGASASLQLSDVLGVALGTGVGGAVVATGARVGWHRSTSILVVDLIMLSVAVVALGPAGRLGRDP